MAKKATYKAVRAERRLGIGRWSGDLYKGETLSTDTHPPEVLDALLTSGLIVESEAPDA